MKLQTQSRTQHGDEIVTRWCVAFTAGNYPVCGTTIQELLAFAAEDPEGDYHHFGRKALAQTLHFLGDQKAALAVAEEVLLAPERPPLFTPLRPRISVSILRTRIACMRGDFAAGRDLLKETIRIAHGENDIPLCQTMALAAIPMAFWADDAEAARQAIATLRRTAQLNRLNYWTAWGENVATAYEIVFGGGLPDDVTGIAFDQLDPKQADHLAALDSRLISDLVIRRVNDRKVGWIRIEVLRSQAVVKSWSDPLAAAGLLQEARDLAAESGVTVWSQRLAEAETEIAGRLDASVRQTGPGAVPTLKTG